jgi:hypothetical protein
MPVNSSSRYCERCQKAVSGRDHRYNVHTKKGRRRNRRYEKTEKGKQRQLRSYDRKVLQKARE